MHLLVELCLVLNIVPPLTINIFLWSVLAVMCRTVYPDVQFDEIVLFCLFFSQEEWKRKCTLDIWCEIAFVIYVLFSDELMPQFYELKTYG